MRRFCFYLFLIVVCFFLQTGLFAGSNLIHVVPNLLLVLTWSAAITRGPRDGILVGFFCGLLYDFLYADYLGTYALLLVAIGALNGLFSSSLERETMLGPMIFGAASNLVYDLVIYLIGFGIPGTLSIWTALLHIILPEMLYTFLLSLILYRIVLKGNLKLEEWERRSEATFVS